MNSDFKAKEGAEGAQQDHQKRLDSFNDHQKDNRGRITLLANYVFVLAGASFTASVTVFSSRPKEEITSLISGLLHDSWFGLFASVVSFLAVIAIMIARDYFFAELTWRPSLTNETPVLNSRSGVYKAVDFLLLLAGAVGIYAFVYGLYNLTKAATAFVT